MDKLAGILGIARSARKISYGEQVLNDIRCKKAYLVLIAVDASENTKKKLIDKCTYYQINYYLIDTELLNHAVGLGNIRYLAINDSGFAKKISSLIK